MACFFVELVMILWIPKERKDSYYNSIAEDVAIKLSTSKRDKEKNVCSIAIPLITVKLLNILGSKKTEIDNRIIFDSSMPRVTIKCPECYYNEAVYMVFS